MLVPSGKRAFDVNSKFDVVNYGSVQGTSNLRNPRRLEEKALSARETRQRSKEFKDQLVRKPERIVSHQRLNQALREELKKHQKKPSRSNRPDDRWTPLIEQKKLDYFVKRNQQEQESVPLGEGQVRAPAYMHIMDHSLQLARGKHSLEDAIELDLDERVLGLKVNELSDYVKQQVLQDAHNEQEK